MSKVYVVIESDREDGRSIEGIYANREDAHNYIMTELKPRNVFKNIDKNGEIFYSYYHGFGTYDIEEHEVK